MFKKYLAIMIIILFILSAMSTLGIGYDKSIVEQEISVSSGPMNSPWPMSCHDNHHTGRSPYSTADNLGIEKWRFKCDWIEGGIVIGDDGTIYFGDEDWDIYAINPNGSLKWKYHTGGDITSSPAIAEDGIIYFGSWDCKLYAFYPNGILKWSVSSGGGTIASSPAIAYDGTIYISTMRGFDKGDIVAFYPNGTKKWIYETDYYCTSDPAIGDDGTIYCGSMDNHLYALNPDGTLRWRFETGHYIQGPASITDDDTIYIGSWDDYLYALNQDGTMKWKCKVGAGTKTNPSIASDGTIYVGGEKLYSINPNGNIKWTNELGPGRHVTDSSPAISADGTIYVGTNIGETSGGDIIALNPNGTIKWSKKIANNWVDSSPCIGEDGTVYIGSSYNQGKGYLHAFGSVDSNVAPEEPTISGTVNGAAGEEYYYSFISNDLDNNPISYFIEWGDGTTSETVEYASGEKAWAEHIFNEQGTYTIRAKAIDTLGEESDWGELTVSMPRYKPSTKLYWLLEESYSRFFSLLRQLFDL